MYQAVPSPYLAATDGTFSLAHARTSPEDPLKKSKQKARLADLQDELRDLQRRLYAQDRWAALAVFQAMDAAGKDGTIRAVFRGVNPAGCQVYSFKAPSKQELDHDFLWRTARSLPERGRIGVFNRSHYEEVLVVRVHPGFLRGQRLPDEVPLEQCMERRLESIVEHERHLARNGVMVVKFFLNVSRDEQARRLLARIDDPKRNWKFSSRDVAERDHWAAYQDAYEQAIKATSKPWAPWYVVPADDKPSMRTAVADILVRSLRSLEPDYPQADPDELANLDAMRTVLLDQLGRRS